MEFDQHKFAVALAQNRALHETSPGGLKPGCNATLMGEGWAREAFKEWGEIPKHVYIYRPMPPVGFSSASGREPNRAERRARR